MAEPLASVEGADERPDERPVRRRLLRDAVFLAVVAMGGWLAVWYWVAPAPLGTSASEVPRVLELPSPQAGERLERLGFRVRVASRRPHPSLPAGTVIWQDPAPGTALSAGAAVELAVSDGAPEVPVPDVSGFAPELAREVVEAAGLRVGGVDTVRRASAAEHVVLSTRPAAGATRTAGGTVELVVSVPVPARANTSDPESDR